LNLFKFFCHNPLLYFIFSQTYLCLSHNDIILWIVWNARGRKTKENNKTVETSEKDKYHSMGDRMRNPKNQIRIANFFLLASDFLSAWINELEDILSWRFVGNQTIKTIQCLGSKSIGKTLVSTSYNENYGRV